MSDIFVSLSAPNSVTYSQPRGLFINNEFVKSTAGKTITSMDPATKREIASVFAAGASDVDTAVKAARKALHDPSWKKISATERGNLLLKLAELVEKNQEILATIDTWDNGKPYSIALGEDLPETFNTLRYYGCWADKIAGQTISTTPQKFAYTLRQPIGVVGQIIPWNYPLAMAAWKLGPALACGNTVVIKAAEQTPLSILYLATLIKEAGFPPGVVNVINGFGAEAGAALVSHPLVDKIAFTGSTATARDIMKMAAGTLKNITLETGGKSPLLVFPDADLEQAAKWSHVGIMHNQGQVCCATSRILVHESVYDEFLKKFLETIRTTSIVGDPFAADTYQGPQVSLTQYERVLSYAESAKREGATLVCGGEPLEGPGAPHAGYFVKPTVFTDVEPSMKVWQDEVFGPFVVIKKFKTESEAVELANSTQYGLGAAVFTRDIERAHQVAADIEAGMVWINSSNDGDFRIPFGGVKQSGIGRELGEAGLEAYTQVKAIHVNLGSKL